MHQTIANLPRQGPIKRKLKEDYVCEFCDMITPSRDVHMFDHERNCASINFAIHYRTKQGSCKVNQDSCRAHLDEQLLSKIL
jgi:hypothetical protein